jgi:hypothetical protein
MNVDNIAGGIFVWAGIIFIGALSYGLIPFVLTSIFVFALRNKLSKINIYYIDGFIACVLINIISMLLIPYFKLELSVFLMLISLYKLSRMKYFRNKGTETLNTKSNYTDRCI